MYPFTGGVAEVPRLLVAAGAIIVADEILGLTVLALASGTSFTERLRANWDIRLGLSGARFGLAIIAAYLLLYRSWLALGVPLAIVGLSILSKQRLRAREEREAWQALAESTDELSSVELEHVLGAAVRHAAQIFSADEAEVEVIVEALTPEHPRRLVRGDKDRVGYDGPPEEAPTAPGWTLAVALESRDGLADVGELRLRFRNRVALTEREEYTLRSFTASLCRAVHNAILHAQTVALSESHAHAARHDQLTGLVNRQHLEELGQAAIDAADGALVALLVIDLDHFNELNNALGHLAGDTVLANVALRLSAAAGESDVLARLGGDEFGVLIGDLGAPALAVSRARHLLAALTEPTEIDGMRLGLRISAGVALAPATGGVDELLRRADLAMHHAKRTGQRLVLFSESIEAGSPARLQLDAELPRAVERREFTLEYQPIVDLGTGEVVSAEALARWRHPSQGDLGPAYFIPTIEQSPHLLPAFSTAVLEEALRAVGTWRAAGWNLPVAVNVSPRSILNPTFPELVSQLLAQTGVPAGLLILEITESVTLSHLEVVDDVLNRLAQMGVRIALDDFGTGFSSLATLARVPVHELKIDRGFVATVGRGRRGHRRTQHHRPGSQPGHDGGGRGCGERGTAPATVGAGLPRRSGVPVLPLAVAAPATCRTRARVRGTTGRTRRRPARRGRGDPAAEAPPRLQPAPA